MTDTSNISVNPFPYIQQPKNHTLQTDSKSWKQIYELPSIEQFWKRKDPKLLDEFETTLGYIESLVLTEGDIRDYPTEMLKLFEVMQCLLEIKDTDAENADNLELDLQDSEAENDKIRRDLERMQDEVEKYKADVQRLTTESQSHRQDKIHQRELEDKIAEVTEWKKRCHDKDTTLSNLNADLDEARRQLREMENNYNKAQQKARMYKEEISTLTAMERKMRGRNVEDDKVIRDLEDKIERLEAEREEMKLELEETTDRLIQFKEDMVAAKRVETELRQALKINQNEISERTRDAEERLVSLNKLQEKLETQTEEHNHELENLRSEFEQEIRDLQMQNGSLLKEIRVKDDNIIAINRQVVILQQQQEQSKTTVTFAKPREPPLSAGGVEMGSPRGSVSSSMTDSERYVPVASYANEEDQTELVRELREEISLLKQRIEDLSSRADHGPATGDSDDAFNDAIDPKEELESLRTTKIRLEDDVIRLQEDMREVEKELLWSKQKIKAYEDGQSGLEIAKRDIRYYKEQIVKREETIEKYKKLLNLYLNNIEDLRWILEALYKNYNHPADKRVNVKTMQDDLHKNLLDMLLQEERRRLANASKHSDADYEKLQNQLSQWKKTHAHSNDEYNQLMQQMEELRQLNESRAQLSGLPEQNQRLKAEVTMLNEKLNTANSTVHQLKQQLHEAERQADRMTTPTPLPEPSNDASHLKAQYNQLKTKHQQVLSALESAQRENASLQSQVESLQQELEMGFKRNRDQKDLTKSQAQSAIEQMEQKLRRHKQREQALQDELNSVRQKNDALNAEVGRLKTIIQEIKDRPLGSLMPEIPATGQSEQVSQLRSQLQYAERQIQALTLQYQNDKNAHTKARKDLLTSNNRIIALQRQCDELNHQVQLGERQIRMLREQIAKQNDRNASAQNGTTHREGQSIATNDLRSPQYIEAQKEIRDLQRQLDDAQDEIHSLRNELSELKDMSEGQKMREEEWKNIQERLKYHEETLQQDQETEKKQTQQMMKQVVAGYNVMISQKDRTIEKYSAQVQTLRQDLLREKRRHEQELEDYKNMLKSQDTKLLQELRLHMNALETQPAVEPGPAQGMALEDVEELMAEKNRVIDQVSEENSLLRNRISDMETNQQSQFDNFYKMKRHLEEEIERQEREIQQLQFELNSERNKPPQIITQPGETKIITKTKKVIQKPSEDTQQILTKTRSDLLQERSRNEHLRQSIETLTQNLVDAQTALARKQVFQEQDFETQVERSIDKRTSQWKHAAKELKSQAGILSAALDKKQKILEALQEKYVEAQREIAAKEQVMTRQNEAISRLNRAQNRLQKELDALRKGGDMNVYAQEKIEDLEKRLKVLQQKQGGDTTSIKKETEDLKLQYKHNREELVQQRKLNDQAEENLRNAERNHQREVQKYLKKISQLEEERQQALDQRDEATLAVSQLKQKIVQNKTEHEQQVRDAQNKYRRGLQSAQKAEKPNENSPVKEVPPTPPRADGDEVEKLLLEHKKEMQQLREKHEKETHRLNTDLNRAKTLMKEKDIKLQQLLAQNTSLSEGQQTAFKSGYASEIDDLRKKLSDYYSLKEELQSIMTQMDAEREKHALEVRQLHEKLLNANIDPEERRSALDEELLAKRKENLDLRFEKEELKQQLITFETKLKDLELIQAVQQEIVSAAPTSSLAASRVISTTETQSQNQQQSTGKASRQELEKVIDAMKSVITKLQEDNDKLKKSAISNREYMDLMNKQKILKGKLTVLRKEREKLQKENEGQEDAREKLTKTLDQNVQLNKRLKREKEITAKHIKKQQALETEKQKLEDELQKIKDHMTSAHNAALARQKMLHEQRIKDIAEQKQKYKTKCDQLQARIREIEKETEKNQVKLSDVQHKLEEERLHTQERIHDLEEQLAREKQRAATKPRTEAVAVDASQDSDAVPEREEHSDSEEETAPPVQSRRVQQEIEYYQQQMVNLKKQNNDLVARIRTLETLSSSGDKYMRRVKELEMERDHLLQENKEQREELDQFDESFFEELEDLKYKYMEERRQNEEYRRQLRELGVEVRRDDE